MKSRALSCIALLVLLVPVAAVTQEIPSGTVLPVMLNATLDANKDKPGKQITGKIMQDVPLLDGSVIPKGARIVGHVVSASPASAGSPSRLAIRFDQVIVKGRQIPIGAHLRALASMMEVFEAKMPTNAFDDYGTSSSDWNTVQVGGAGVYRGTGEVVSDGQVVGRATDYGAVTARLIAAPASGCHPDDNTHEQALWVFSPSACGLYGFGDLHTAHRGRTEPIGQIEFQSGRDIYVHGGSGWLLQIEATTAPSPAN